MPTLTTYTTEVRRLLHDANAQFWSDTELADYINSGRERVVRDTGCLRSLQSLNLVVGQEAYNVSALPSGSVTLDILNINVIWGTSVIPLYYMPWSQFNAQLRYWQNNQGRPAAFSMYGQTQVMIRPKPDQIYATEWDTVIQPNTLIDGTTVEQIPIPFTSCIAFYAAYKAKYKEQSFKEAEIFLEAYQHQINAAIRSSFTRRLPSPF